MDIDLKRLIEALKLEPLPVEGGRFRQTYLSPESIPAVALPARYGAGKPFGSAILGLFTDEPDSFSAMHRLPTDEVYHFYLGDPMEMLLLYPNGLSERIVLGSDIFSAQKLQFTVPRGVWQGSSLLAGGRYALLGATMAPGFEARDYEGARREALLKAYPQEAERIVELTRPEGETSMLGYLP